MAMAIYSIGTSIFILAIATYIAAAALTRIAQALEEMNRTKP